MHHPGRFWHRIEDGRIECAICPRRCQLKEGQRGLCFVRMRENNQIVLTTYGRSSGFCVDPIEKKPLYHFLPGSPILSFGTAGCNLSCKFCQNWDISKSREMDTLADEASPALLTKTCKDLGCESIAFTYNDPVIFHEYAIDVADACRAEGIKSVAVTAGYTCPEARKDFYQHMDAANVDLKAFTEQFYQKVCAGELKPVLETLVYLKEHTSVWFEITTLLIPGENDSSNELKKMTKWIVANLGPDVPIHFTAFHPDWKMTDHDFTPLSTLIRAREIALENGMHYVYTGNLPSEKSESTYCPKCKALMIGRAGYTITGWELNHGKCGNCGMTCPGFFHDQPGDWGSRRLPVRLSEFRA